MKILKRFEALCRKCSKSREYCETESDLGWISVACTRWCACDPQEIVTGIPSDPEGSAKVDPKSS